MRTICLTGLTRLHYLAVLLTIAGLGSVGAAQAGDPVLLPMTASQWQEVVPGKDIKPNLFEFTHRDGHPVMQIYSNGSMSMMAIPVNVDLKTTPVLCWRWRVNRVLQKADMTERSGDDYAARLYLSITIPKEQQSLGLRMQLGLARSIWGDQIPDGAINYVWDNRQPVGTTMANAYTDRVTMVVAQSGPQNVGNWTWQRQDLASDIARLFTPQAQPVQIALAADTDNTGESVRTEFADIRFVARDASCGERPQ